MVAYVDDDTDERDDVDVAIDNVLRRHEEELQRVELQYGTDSQQPQYGEFLDNAYEGQTEQDVNSLHVDYSPEKGSPPNIEEDSISHHQYSSSYQQQQGNRFRENSRHEYSTNSNAPTPSKARQFNKLLYNGADGADGADGDVGEVGRAESYMAYHDTQAYEPVVEQYEREPLHSSRSQKGSRHAALRTLYGTPESKKMSRSNSFQYGRKGEGGHGSGSGSGTRTKGRGQRDGRSQSATRRSSGRSGEHGRTGKARHFASGVPSWISRS